MEEKKNFDFNTLIGFILIGGILFWTMYMNQGGETNETTPKNQQEQVDNEQANPEQNNAGVATPEKSEPSIVNDSTVSPELKARYGDFAYNFKKGYSESDFTVIENDVLKLKISNLGGQIIEAKLKDHLSYKDEPIYQIKDGNANFSINFKTKDNREIATSELYFSPVKKEGNSLSMRAYTSENEYLEFYYSLKQDDYMMDFDIRSKGLGDVIDPDQEAKINWQLRGYRHAKSISYENQYTEIVYQYEGDNSDYTGQGDVAEEEDKDVDWVAFKQHFFSSILLSDEAFKRGKFISKNLVEDEDVDTTYTRNFKAELSFDPDRDGINRDMNWYYGPTDYKILDDYERNLDEIVPLGWGIFGFINKYLFIPYFNIISGFIGNFGIAIILMTITIRLILSPVTYKSYLSQAKMKVLKPQIDAITKKHGDDQMKKQQETMKLYNKTGVSPLSGCIPALLQMPIFIALFRFFPSTFELRQKNFLWADDLSSYDSIAELPFYIPFYGDHVSLFPILASVAIFFYMMMTTGQNAQPTQPGMPNMKVIMYISPLVMLVFFNNYASGLSLYYFISNLITIGIMLVIKNYIIDNDKILAKIEEKKKKPKKKGKFARKMQQIMEQAEEQKKLRDKKK
jgi:YidC/Oxa1 family membrane protein insertase